MTEQVLGKTSVPVSATANGITKSRSFSVLPWATVTPPTSLKFNGVVVGTTSEPLRATLTNSGPSAFAVLGISVVGTGASRFAQTNDCPVSLEPGASCGIDVTFRPLEAKRSSAQLSIATGATTAPLKKPLSGTSLPP